MRPDVIDVFCQEMPGRVCVVTNGTFPLKRFDDLYFYWVSLDGTEKVHDSIRGQGSYAKTRNTIMEYISGPPSERETSLERHLVKYDDKFIELSYSHRFN